MPRNFGFSRPVEQDPSPVIGIVLISLVGCCLIIVAAMCGITL